MDYLQHPPPPALARHVESVWRLRAPVPDGVQTIYPDGRCEIIVHLAGPPRCWDAADGWHEQARTLFAAQRVTAVRLASRGALDCVGVRLMPAASALVAPRGLGQLRDRIVDLATLDSPLSQALRGAARRFAAGDAGALWRLLERRCAAHAVDARIERATARLEATGGRARIDAIARAAALSIRGLQTRFRAQVGLAPKEFARVLRLQATLRALDTHDASLAAIASETGFADQAHVTRELKAVTGLTPARLRAALRADRGGDAAIEIAAAFVRGHARQAIATVRS